MAMIAGTVVVADDGTETITPSSLAGALYAAEKATSNLLDPNVVPSDWQDTTASWATIALKSRVGTLRDVARRANAYASALVTYIPANAAVVVTVPADASGDNVQNGTTHPGSPKNINGTIS